MKTMLNRMVAAQAIDAATFILFIVFFAAGSIHAEQNPLINLLVGLGGVQLVGVVKIGLALVVRHRALKPRTLSLNFEATRFTMITLATASGIVGAGFNTASIISSLAAS